MKRSVFIFLLGSLLGFGGCYTIEEADNVNQERIATYYETIFDATNKTTSTRIDFRFGQTPLRLNNALYFEGLRLYEKRYIISGLHYQRQIPEILEGQYEWTDERGISYSNFIQLYQFDLLEPVEVIKKHTSSELPWIGDQIPYGNWQFTVTVQSLENYLTCTFHVGQTIRILPEHLATLPIGRANLTITRRHSEPIDEGTQAGGESTVFYKRIFEIGIEE